MSKTKKSKKVHQPDDKFFKEVMLRKTSVSEYLLRIHPNIAKLVDLRTLKLSKDSFLSPDLETFTSDIVWKCKFKNSEKETFLSFLWEHKMQEHKNYSIQAGLYIFLYLHRRVNIDKKPLEPILPFLFYNGKNPKWRPPTMHELFGNLPGFDAIKSYIPEFEPLFLNISGSTPVQIEKIQNAFLKSAFYAFSMRHREDLLIKNISVIFGNANDNFEVRALFLYVTSVFKMPAKELIERINDSDFKNKNNVMSTLDLIKKEGFDKGMQIGINKEKEENIKATFQKQFDLIKTMHKEQLTEDFIARVLKIKLQYVTKVLNGKIKNFEEHQAFFKKEKEVK